MITGKQNKDIDNIKLDAGKISERIAYIMKSLNFNQKEFALHLRLTQPAISKYLNGRIPPANVLLQLAQISRMNIEWILTGKTDNRPGYVAEPVSGYHRQSNLSQKIENLPKSLQKQIENLVDEFNKIVKK